MRFECLAEFLTPAAEGSLDFVDLRPESAEAFALYFDRYSLRLAMTRYWSIYDA